MHFALDFKILTEGDGQSTKIFSNLRSGGKASIFSAVPSEHRQVSITFWYFDSYFPCVDLFTFFSYPLSKISKLTVKLPEILEPFL